MNRTKALSSWSPGETLRESRPEGPEFYKCSQMNCCLTCCIWAYNIQKSTQVIMHNTMRLEEPRHACVTGSQTEKHPAPTQEPPTGAHLVTILASEGF